MKLAVKITFILGIACFLMLYSGCKKKDPTPPSITEQQLTLLTKSAWKVNAVTKDLVDQMADYGTFQITFTKTSATTFSFHTSGRPASKYPWPVNGNFTFDATNPSTKLTRNDTPPVIVTYSVTATALTMSFNYSGAGFSGDRQTIVTGQWLFTFVH